MPPRLWLCIIAYLATSLLKEKEETAASETAASETAASETGLICIQKPLLQKPKPKRGMGLASLTK
jgi:hypothetical protein